MTLLCLELKTFSQRAEKITKTSKGGRTALVSVGIAADDGRCFYAVNRELDFHQASASLPWEAIEALPVAKDPLRLDWDDSEVMTMEKIKELFEAFIARTDNPQFWSAYGNGDLRDLRDVFGYYTDCLYPPGFPRWISSAREQLARVIDAIGYRDPDLFHQLRATGEAGYGAQQSRRHHAFANAHHTLRELQRCEALAKENGVDTSVREPARLDWSFVRAAVGQVRERAEA
ncbi:hypothetical protein [Streptomyces hebeiensis]